MLAVFESHPVQYRAPVYQALQLLVPDQFRVFYATDITVRGNRDREFGTIVAWDEPLLEGYPNTVLKQERGEPFKGFRSLHGYGIGQVFDQFEPRAVLQPQHLYEYDFAVLMQARLRAIPVWIRQETQDEAGKRSKFKGFMRSIAYRLLYSQVAKAFFIGEMNRRHLLKHGVSENQLVRSPYCTPNRFHEVSDAQFTAIRKACRQRLGVGDSQIVVGFFGKLISKKNPDILLHAMPLIPESVRKHLVLLFVGSGALEAQLREHARELESQYGVSSIFAGFVNQSGIRSYYAATDIMALPSRRAGETWGLVVNEAFQAGCSVVISDAVGCGSEYKDWERIRIIPVENARALADAVDELSQFSRDFGWAHEGMTAYSVERAAEALAAEIRKL